MNISQLLKTVQFNLLQQSGIAVNPAQLGLKTTGYGNSYGGFSSYLNPNVPKAPVIPVAPEDLTNTEAVKAFYTALVTYSQNYQTYNQQMYTYMNLQFRQMQTQMMAQAYQTKQSNSSTSAIGSSSSVFSTGDII